MANIQVQNLGPEDVNTTKRVVLVAVAGDLDQASIEQDSAEIEQIIEQAKPGTFVLFDLSNLEYINSRSISFLVNWYMTLEKNGSKLCLFSLRPNIFDILETTGLASVMPIFTNFAEIKTAIEENRIKPDSENTTLDQVDPSSPKDYDPDNLSVHRPHVANVGLQEPKPAPVTENTDSSSSDSLSINRPSQSSPKTETGNKTTQSNQQPTDDTAIDRNIKRVVDQPGTAPSSAPPSKKKPEPVQKEPNSTTIPTITRATQHKPEIKPVSNQEQSPPKATPAPPEPIQPEPEPNEKTEFRLLDD